MMPGAPAPSGVSRVSRIVAGWRAHPALVLLVAVLALAAGYIIHADKTGTRLLDNRNEAIIANATASDRGTKS